MLKALPFRKQILTLRRISVVLNGLEASHPLVWTAFNLNEITPKWSSRANGEHIEHDANVMDLAFLDSDQRVHENEACCQPTFARPDKGVWSWNCCEIH